jgi:hypothetical protein
MKYEDLKWERRNEYEWGAAVQGGYEIVWQVRDDGIAVLHGKPPATGGAVRMKTIDAGVARVKVALELIENELNAPLSKEEKARLTQESENTLKNEQ